jgi:putative ABC transport system permease protein
MRLQALVYFYGRRLRSHPIQELLAGLGVAIGVSLAFAVIVANSSVVSSAAEIVDGVTGSADLQLTARDSNGFDERMLHDVRRLPGVRRAAPVLERRGVIVGPDGTQSAVNLVSVDRSLARLSGGLTRSFLPGGLQLRPGGMMLPSGVADTLGIQGLGMGASGGSLPRVTLYIGGRAERVTVAAVLGEDTVGPLTGAKVGIVPLDSLQRLAGLEDRLSRVLVVAAPGREAEVRRGLELLADDRLAVTSAGADLDLLKQATEPTDQVTGFFAAVSALLGLLLAFNAMLLTAPERRRLVSSLRLLGYRPRQVAAILLFQAFVLGAVASLVGVLVGNVLANAMFDGSPEYLAPGFTMGGRTVIDALPLVLALSGGIVMSCVASAPPLLDLRRGRAVDAVFRESGSPGNALGRRTAERTLAGSVACIAVAALLLAFEPRLALVASALLAVATLLAIPSTFKAVTALMGALVSRVPRFSTLTVALLSMRATTLRSLALAATGAVAVFGSVAIGGARHDLLAGIGDYTADYVETADMWVVNPYDNQAINDFEQAGLVDRIEGLPEVASVRPYHGGFLDMEGRRVWVIARPRDDSEMLPPSSMVAGDFDVANAALRETGSVAISDQIARSRGLESGDDVAVPTPTGTVRFQIAATITNLGWAPGALILNSADYSDRWASRRPSALEVDLAAGADPPAVHMAIDRVLRDAAPGLVVQHASERGAAIDASARQGLERLSQISLLLQIAAVLAMAAAMGAAIWQRRSALAALRIQSFRPRQLWVLLLIESGAVLGAGGVTGALGGTYGRFGADRFLEVVTGFPVAPTLVGWNTAITFAVVVGAALAIVAVPGWFATRVPPRLGLGTE